MKVNNTPTPWCIKLAPTNSETTAVIYQCGLKDHGNQRPVAYAYSLSDAAFIIQTCNMHKELVFALSRIANMLDKDNEPAEMHRDQLRGIAYEVLAKNGFYVEGVTSACDTL